MEWVISESDEDGCAFKAVGHAREYRVAHTNDLWLAVCSYDANGEPDGFCYIALQEWRQRWSKTPQWTTTSAANVTTSAHMDDDGNLYLGYWWGNFDDRHGSVCIPPELTDMFVRRLMQHGLKIPLPQIPEASQRTSLAQSLLGSREQDI